MNSDTYQKAHKSIALYNASRRFGRVAARGIDAIDLLHRMSTNDLLPLIDKPGSGSQTVLTTEKGRIIDLVTILSHGKGALLTTSSGKEDEVIGWLEKFVIMEDAQFVKKSDEILQFLVFGPKAMEFLEKHIFLVGASGSSPDGIGQPAEGRPAGRPYDLIGLMQYHFL